MDIRKNKLPYVDYLVYFSKNTDKYVNLPNQLEKSMNSINIQNSANGKMIMLDRLMYVYYVRLSPKLLQGHRYILQSSRYQFLVLHHEFILDYYSTQTDCKYYFRLTGYFSEAEITIYRGKVNKVERDKYPLLTELCTDFKNYIKAATYKPSDLFNLANEVAEIKNIILPLGVSLQIFIGEA